MLQSHESQAIGQNGRRAGRGHAHQLKTDLGEDVDIVRIRQVQVVAEGGRVDVVVPQFLAQLLAALLVDPDGQQLIEALGGDIQDEFARLLGVFLEGNLAAIGQANVTVGRRDDDGDAFAYGLWGGVLILLLGFGLWQGSLLLVGGMPVKLGVFELARAGIIEDGEVALVDVLAESGAAPLHLLVEDGAAQRPDKDDVLDVGCIVAGGQQIDGDRHARFAGADDGEVALQLVAVALGSGDAGGVIVIARETAQLLRHEGGMRVVDAEDDGLLVAQTVLAENLPKVFGNGPCAIRHADVALKVRCRIVLAVGAGVAILIDVGDTFLEQVRHEVAILDGLLEAVGVDGIAEILIGVAPLLLIGQRPGGFLQLARSGRKTQLKRAAEMLQHAEPVAKAGAVTLVDHHKIEEIRVVVLVELLAIQLLIESLVVGKEDLADQMLALGNGLLVDGDALIRRECGKGSISLILEAVAVGEEEDVLPLERVAVHHLPDELEDGEGLASARGHQQKRTTFALGELPQGLGDGHFLVGTNLLARNLVDVETRSKGSSPSDPNRW